MCRYVRYVLCLACHGPTGKGVAVVGPPLAGSDWVNGPPENLIRIQLRGLSGPITVNGQEYSFAAPMPPQAVQNDEEIAAVPAEFAHDIAKRIRDAAEMGDVTTLNAIAEEIKDQSDSCAPLSKQIVQMAEDFDLDGIQKLADDLDAC